MKFEYRTENNAKAVAAFWGKTLSDDDSYSIRASSADETEIFIFDVLGWPFNDVNALVRDVAKIKTRDILVRLNSPGGDPIDTFALYHALREHPAKVVVRIESLAASAASFLALAGDKVQAYPSSLIMIHNSFIATVGNQYQLREVAEILEKIDDNMADVYEAGTKVKKREIVEMMKNETWLNAKEAKEKGFIDEIIDGKAAKALFDLTIFSNVPETVRPEVTPSFVERILREAGFSRSEAKALLARGWQGLTNSEAEAAESLLVKLQNLTSQIKAALTHNSTLADSEPDWGDIDKTKLPRNAFADQGEPDKKSTWKYPHHWVKNGKVGDDGVYASGDMYLHKGGLNAAWAAAQGARTGKKAAPEVIAHLEKHRKAIGE